MPAPDASIYVAINGDDSGLTNALKKAANNIAKFGYTLNGRITEGLVDPTRKAKVEFKDVARIVAGIMVSKVFYTGLNMIRNATDAVKEFNVELEYTKTAFANIFNNADLADELVNVLKDFSAVSPFGFTDASKAAKQLLAYGIQYKNVMYVMQGVMDAATVMGDPSKIESISRALGQIYTKGVLKAEEVRQLAEAGVPAYDILQDKLKLTAEGMQNISKQAIPASVAINAFIDGIHERFSGMTKASTKTMQGMVSNIKDNLLVFMAGTLDPLYQRMRNIVHAMDLFANKLRETFDLRGLGGVFEMLVPDKQAQAEIRQFIALIQELGHVIGYGLKNALILGRDLLLGIIRVINTVGPILINVAQIISLVLREITKCEPAMKTLAYLLMFNAGAWLAFKAAALGAKILAPITQLVLNLAKALAMLAAAVTAHPLIAGFVILAGVVTALGIAHTEAGQRIRDFFTQLTKWNGVDPGEQALPETKKRTADLEKFNEKLDNTADMLDQTGDAAEEAAKKGKKAQKDLLSFDEVFRLTKQDADDDDIESPGWEMPDFDLGLDDMDLGGIVPDFADTVGFDFDAQLDKLKNKIAELWERFKDQLPGILSGAGLGALIGGLIGGPLGAALGALAGGLVGYFWDTVADTIGINDKWHAAIASGLLGGFLALVAFLMGGGPILTVLAGLAGFFGGLLWEKIAEAFGLEGAKKQEAAISSAIVGALGAVIGGILGGPAGAVLGGLIGAFAGEFWSILADHMGLTDGAKLAGIIGAAIVGVLEMAVLHASPLAALSAALLASSWITAFVQGIQTGDWSHLSTAIATTLGYLAFGPIAAIIGSIVGGLYQLTFGMLEEKFGIDLKFKLIDMLQAGVAGAATALSSIITGSLGGAAKAGFIGFIASLGSSLLSNLLLNWLGNEFDLTKQDIEAGKTFGSIGGVIGAIIGAFFGPLGIAIGTAVGTLAGTLLGAFKGVDILKWFHEWWDPFAATAGPAIKGFFTETIPNAWNDFWGWLGGLPESLNNWASETEANIQRDFDNFSKDVDNFFFNDIPNGWNNFTSWLDGIPGEVDAWAAGVDAEAQKNFDNFSKDVDNFFFNDIPNGWSSFTSWLDGIPGEVDAWANRTGADLQRNLDEFSKNVDKFFFEDIPNGWNEFTSWVDSIPGKVQGFFDDLGKRFTEFGGNLVQGLINGFTEGWNNIGKWIDERVQEFTGFFTGGWGINSPSTVFYSIGLNLVQGLFNGFTNMWSTFTSFVGPAIAGLTTEVTTGFSNLLTNVTTLATNIGTNIQTFAANTATSIATWATNTATNLATWATNTGTNITAWATNTGASISSWAISTATDFMSWVTNTGTSLSSWASSTAAGFTSWVTTNASSIASWAVNTGQNIASWVTNTVGNFGVFAANAGSNIASFVTNGVSNIQNFGATTASNISSWAAQTASNFTSWASQTASNFMSWVSQNASSFSSWSSQTASQFSSWASQTASNFTSWASQTASNIASWASQTASAAANWASNFASNVRNGLSNALSNIHSFVSSAASAISSWASSAFSAISNVVSNAVSAASRVASLPRHATGGIFNREHIAHVAEGNKAEAIIPLENAGAMQPFVDAVAGGLAQYLGPVLANMQNTQQSTTTVVNDALPPMYVGTLIADDRSLRELERRMQVIRMTESNRSAYRG